MNAYENKIAQTVFRNTDRTVKLLETVLRYLSPAMFVLYIYISVTRFMNSRIMYEMKLASPASK